MASRNGTLKLEDGRKLELVGVWEAHEIVGVERSRFARWLAPRRKWIEGGRKGAPPELAIPTPLADLRSGPVWLKSDIVKFAREFAERRSTAGAK